MTYVTAAMTVCATLEAIVLAQAYRLDPTTGLLVAGVLLGMAVAAAVAVLVRETWR